jgi:hypothetical protein
MYSLREEALAEMLQVVPRLVVAMDQSLEV